MEAGLLPDVVVELVGYHAQLGEPRAARHLSCLVAATNQKSFSFHFFGGGGGRGVP
jgi:hypothetical protein